MSELIPPSRQALSEALILSNEVIRNIELGEIPLSNIVLKASRLARLLNDFDMQKTLGYEGAGYPSTPSGVPQDVYRLAAVASREYSSEDKILKTTKKGIYLDSIGSLEEQIRTTEAALAAARDPEKQGPPRMLVANVEMPSTNSYERGAIRQASQLAAQRLSARRDFIYQYVLRKHYELKFSGIADDVFSRIRERVDSTIGLAIPESVQRLSAIYENLHSDNPEDWSNAVHGCRRLLQALADSVFPPSDEVRVITIDGKPQTVKLGTTNYINRIIAFVEDHAESGRFREIVGSHISFLGDRLDGIFQAANKGSHDTIVSQEEADRYVVYTYLLIGDILSLT